MSVLQSYEAPQMSYAYTPHRDASGHKFHFARKSTVEKISDAATACNLSEIIAAYNRRDFLLLGDFA